jgi:hypothetical protein
MNCTSDGPTAGPARATTSWSSAAGATSRPRDTGPTAPAPGGVLARGELADRERVGAHDAEIPRPHRIAGCPEVHRKRGRRRVRRYPGHDDRDAPLAIGRVYTTARTVRPYKSGTPGRFQIGRSQSVGSMARATQKQSEPYPLGRQNPDQPAPRASPIGIPHSYATSSGRESRLAMYRPRSRPCWSARVLAGWLACNLQIRFLSRRVAARWPFQAVSRNLRHPVTHVHR